MDFAEANKILHEHLTQLRNLPYAELKRFIDDRIVKASEILGSSGVRYQLEIQAFWDSKRGGNIRVMVSIDDGGLRAFCPLSSSFIKAPDGSFVGE